MNGSTDNSYDKTFYTALGRERYKQMTKIELSIELNRTIKVKFDKNKGELIGTTDSKQVTHNSTYGTLPEAERTGRGFAGWYTAKEEGVEINPTTRVTKTQEHTLYARWSCTVTFEPNEGNCSEQSRIVIEGNKYEQEGQLPKPTRTGYTFDGWYTEQINGTKVTDETIVPDIGNHTLYAHWTPSSYMVGFNPNGGECSPSEKPITYNSLYGDLPKPKKPNCEFIGWYTNAGDLITEESTVTEINPHILIAHWLYTFDVNKKINGVEEGSSSEGGLFDVYVNGNLVGESKVDFFKSNAYEYGTEVEIKNIREKTGYVYTGAEIYKNGVRENEEGANNRDLKVTITDCIKIVLKFEKIPDPNISFTTGKSFNGREGLTIAPAPKSIEDVSERNRKTANGKDYLIINATFKFDDPTSDDAVEQTIVSTTQSSGYSFVI